jgi:hypothetical protein
MESENSIRLKLKRYLEGLGYPAESVLFEYGNSSRGFIDVVIRLKDSILIIGEIKSSINISRSEIGYDPIARTLQKNAENLAAKFYFISDGKNHIWLNTGVTGRPEIIDPVGFDQFDDHASASDFLKQKLQEVSNFVKSNPFTGDHLYDLSIVLYDRVLFESKSRPRGFREDLFKQTPYLRTVSETITHEITWERVDQLLGGINLRVETAIVLNFIDEVFEENRVEWSVPRWLADFMVKLINLKPKDVVIDLFTRNGVISSQAHLNGFTNVISYFSNQRDFYWIRVQNLLADGNEGILRFEPSPLESNQFFSLNAKGVLIAPPFNRRVNYFNSAIGINDSTVVAAELSLGGIDDDGRIVTIVPDSFLNSSQFKKARSFFYHNFHIESIISLPNDTFHPYSYVKTSLLVIRKTNVPDKKCLFASLDGIPKRKLESPVIRRILDCVEMIRSNMVIEPSATAFVVDKLDVDNFQFSKYFFETKYSDQDQQQPGYLPVPLLAIVESVTRGAPIIEATQNGGITFISPASIRRMQVVRDSLSIANKDKLPANIKYVEKDDILINSIGTHRGAAALVDASLAGMPINRHIILIRPRKDYVLPGYLAVALNSDYVQEQFLNKSAGVIPSLNLKSLDDIFVPLPDLDEQTRIFSEYLKLIDGISKEEQNLYALRKQLNEKLSTLGKEGKSL